MKKISASVRTYYKLFRRRINLNRCTFFIGAVCFTVVLLSSLTGCTSVLLPSLAGGTNEPAPIEQEIESPGKPAGDTTSPETITLPTFSTGEFFSRYNQIFSSRDYDTLLYKTLDPDDFSLEREGEASGTKIYTSCRYIAIGEIERPVRNTEIALTVDQNGAVVCVLSRFGPADEITIEWFSITDWCMLLEAMGVCEEPLEALELTTQIMDEGVFEDGRYRLRVAQNAEVSISISDEGEYIFSIIVL